MLGNKLLKLGLSGSQLCQSVAVPAACFHLCQEWQGQARGRWKERQDLSLFTSSLSWNAVPLEGLYLALELLNAGSRCAQHHY